VYPSAGKKKKTGASLPASMAAIAERAQAFLELSGEPSFTREELALALLNLLLFFFMTLKPRVE